MEVTPLEVKAGRRGAVPRAVHAETRVPRGPALLPVIRMNPCVPRAKRNFSGNSSFWVLLGLRVAALSGRCCCKAQSIFLREPRGQSGPTGSDVCPEELWPCRHKIPQPRPPVGTPTGNSTPGGPLAMPANCPWLRTLHKSSQKRRES